jgi:ergothioneine biosynthesis protein EgtB
MYENKTIDLITPLEMAQYFAKVRAQTIEILDPLEVEDYVIQTEFFMSPPRWHLGHVSWFYDQLLKEYASNYQSYETDFGNYLNSYYQTFGVPFDKGRRGTVSRPTVAETKNYADWINEQVDHFFMHQNGALTDDLKRLFFMAFNHEYQHQELLIYDLQHLLQANYKPKVMREITENSSGNNSRLKDMVRVPGGIFEMGFDLQQWGEHFYYDIEMPMHKVYLNDFLIDITPVTNGDFLEFIQDGGYQDFRHWLSDGWECLKKHNWKAPLYWQQNNNGDWIKTDFRGTIRIKDITDEPVVHGSYYEAWAYAKWAGKRLPTESEWEKAAAWDDDRHIKRLYPWGNDAATDSNSNLFESKIWAPSKIGSYAQGSSYYGCQQMVSDMWEWTSSEFMPYPGFQSGFAEYNDKWFGNQKVLRGGSFATARDQARNSYRNFFRCDERWMIGGFRCAKDA